MNRDARCTRDTRLSPQCTKVRGLMMNADAEDVIVRQSWESVHVCPKCGHVINLADLDLRAVTTGIVNCPSCDWSGQIEIQVIDQVPRKKPTSAG